MTDLPAGLEKLPLHEEWVTAPPLGTSLDAFSFSARVGIYKALIEAMNSRGVFGPDNAHNVLWGLPFQLSWQHRTGRLHPGVGLTDRIHPDAPWAFGNFALSVVPLLGAVEAGLVDDLPIQEPPEPSRFEYIHGGGQASRHLPAEFSGPIDDWRAFFELVGRTAPGEDLEPLLMAMWAAHKSSLDVILREIETIEPRHYPPAEIQFLRGWCRMVDYLWAAAWPTDFVFMVANGTDVLPERVLTEDDVAGKTTDLPANVASNVRSVLDLATTPTWRYGLNLRLWRRAMRTRAARDDVVEMLDAVFNPSPDNRSARRRLLRFTLGF